MPSEDTPHRIAEFAKDIKTGRTNASTMQAHYAGLVDEMLHDENAWDQVKAGGTIVGDTLAVAGLISGTGVGVRYGAERFLAGKFFIPRFSGELNGLVKGVESVRSMSSGTAFDGALYPKDKLRQLVAYLERRNVFVYGTDGNPAFNARADGMGQMYLPENPTVLQVKHELSHYFDFKKMGYES